MSQLLCKKMWLWAGIGWMGLVVYLSVADFSMPQAGFKAGDKLNHLLAYGFLMIWLGQIFESRIARLILMMCLITLGIALEFVQAALPHRWFDWLDALANSIGVIIAAVSLHYGADKLLRWFEGKCRSQ